MIFLFITNGAHLLIFTRSSVVGFGGVIIIAYWLICEFIMREKSAKKMDFKTDKDNTLKLFIYVTIINLLPPILCLCTNYA